MKPEDQGDRRKGSRRGDTDGELDELKGRPAPRNTARALDEVHWKWGEDDIPLQMEEDVIDEDPMTLP